MTVWYKVAWIDPLFAACNQIAPNRGHAEDGTIGDLAHASGVSGHNPDDTAGVTAERQDADSKPEVRAADVDSTGTWPAGISMESVVQAVLHGPADERDRLIYIIFNHRIWRKAGGWAQEAYTGSDPHELHAHFSGDPASDDDARPWTSILNLGADLDAYQNDTLNNIDAWEAGSGAMNDKVEIHRGGQKFTFDNKLVTTIKQQGAKLDAVLQALGVAQADLDELQARPVYNAEALAAELAPVLAGHLTEAELLAALQSDAGQAALVKAANTAEDN